MVLSHIRVADVDTTLAQDSCDCNANVKSGPVTHQSPHTAKGTASKSVEKQLQAYSDMKMHMALLAHQKAAGLSVMIGCEFLDQGGANFAGCSC